jgi:glycosyltransferase involved in cell wall biosynthesis
LKQAVIGLLEDEPRREQMGAAARVIARERYDWRDIGRRLLSIYELAIEGRFDADAAAK